MTPQPPYLVPAVVAASKLLDALAAAGPQGASAAELARSAQISRSSAHNLLATLLHEGLAERDPATRNLRLGPRTVALGAAAAQGRSALGLAVERAGALAHELGLTIAVCQADGDRAVLVEQRTPPAGVHVALTPGSRFGPFDGALGKCLLAGAEPAAARRTIAAGRLPAHTERTLTDPDALLAEVELARERGWATSLGEFRPNNAVAAAIPGADGRPALLLLALGLVDQLPLERVEEVGERLRAVADEIALRSLTPTAASTAAEEPA